MDGPGCNSQHRIQALEDGAEQQQLANTCIDRQRDQMVA